MIAAWMVYALVVTTLFGVGAVLLERALRLARLQGRWIWAGAMAASVVIPAAARSAPAAPTLDVPRLVTAVEAMVPAALPASAGLEAVRTPLLLLWIAGSLIVITLVVATHRRVARDVRDFVPESLHGVPVRRTAGFGPAVVGLLRSVIVVPTWIDLLDDDARRLVLRHELEHQRAGDSRLLFAGVLAAALQPWNIALWWQLARLREALELDCDRRVLESGADLRAYGQLLLALSRRRAPSPLAAVALSNPKTTLDRRITAMTIHHTRGAYARALCAASLGALLVALGCRTPSPVTVEDTAAAEVVAAESVAVESPASPTVNIDLQRVISQMDSARSAGIEPDLDVAEQVELLESLRVLYEEGAIQLRPVEGGPDECPTARVLRVWYVGQDKDESVINITLRPCTDA